MNWKTVLKKHLETVPDSKYEWDKFHEFHDRDFIKIAVDTSQNISDDDWQRFLDEVKAMQKAARWKKIKTILWWFAAGFVITAIYILTR